MLFLELESPLTIDLGPSIFLVFLFFFFFRFSADSKWPIQLSPTGNKLFLFKFVVYEFFRTLKFRDFIVANKNSCSSIVSVVWMIWWIKFVVWNFEAWQICEVFSMPKLWGVGCRSCDGVKKFHFQCNDSEWRWHSTQLRAENYPLFFIKYG